MGRTNDHAWLRGRSTAPSKVCSPAPSAALPECFCLILATRGSWSPPRVSPAGKAGLWTNSAEAPPPTGLHARHSRARHALSGRTGRFPPPEDRLPDADTGPRSLSLAGEAPRRLLGPAGRPPHLGPGALRQQLPIHLQVQFPARAHRAAALHDRDDPARAAGLPELWLGQRGRIAPLVKGSGGTCTT